MKPTAGSNCCSRLSAAGCCMRVVDLDYGEPYDAGLIIINRFKHALCDGGAQNSKHWLTG